MQFFKKTALSSLKNDFTNCGAIVDYKKFHFHRRL